MNQEIEIQRQYYTQTANIYDAIHGEAESLHSYLLASYIEYYNIQSVLDVGAGTGTFMLWLKKRFPHLVVKGIEPVKALREQGYDKGILQEDLIEGDGYNIPFADNSIDLVCARAVLHHVKKPEKVVQEMSRVAARMVGISDNNFMGQGSYFARLLKYTLFLLKLWSVANWMKTKGKGYTISEGDGLAYSYSAYQDLATLTDSWQTVQILGQAGNSPVWFTGMIATDPVLILAGNKRK